MKLSSAGEAWFNSFPCHAGSVHLCITLCPKALAECILGSMYYEFRDRMTIEMHSYTGLVCLLGGKGAHMRSSFRA